jgi:hypothetical protein
MEKVPGEGVAGGSEVAEEKVYPEMNPGCAPENSGMEGSTIDDANSDPALN